MNSKWQQSNFISLSMFFHEIVHPVKVSLSICDPKIVFNDVAYGGCLSQLGKFLSLIDSFIVINVDALTNESPVLISYVNSLNKSIEILRRSLWLLHLAPTIENEKKKFVFQTGIDIIDNAVGIVDETIKIFFSNNFASLLQKELCSNILLLYNYCLKVLPSMNFTSVEVNSTHETQMVEKVVGNMPEFFESTNFSQKRTPNVVEEAEILNNQESFFGDNVAVDPNSMLTPISYQKNITFSDPSHKKLFDKACKYIKDELNYFAFVKSRKLLLMCLLCNTTMRALKARKHIIEKDHLFRRNQVTCSNTVSNTASSLNCGSAQNHLIKHASCIKFAVDSESPPNFSANPSQPVRKSPIDSVILENIPKSQEPSNFYQKTDGNTLKCVNSPSIDELSLSKYLDSVNYNAVQNSHVLSESCISVPEINLQSDPSENSLLNVMGSVSAPALENERKVHENAVDLNLSNVDKGMSIATTKYHDDVCTTPKQKNIRPSSLTRYQDVSESKLLQFARSSHKEAFRLLKVKIKDEVNNFLVHSEPDQKKLKMTCKLCKKYLRASNVEAHIKEREHSQHVTVFNMEEKYNKYLEFCPSDRGYQCTVCKEILFRNNYFIKDLLYGHFRSETHRQNERKFNESFPSCQNVENNVQTNLLIESESGFMKKEKISDLQLEQHSQCDERYMSHDSSNNCFFSADVPINIKTFSTLKNMIENGVQSEDCGYTPVERIEPTTENGGLSNASRHFSSGSLEENSLRISGVESDNASLNNSEATPVQGAKNVPVLPAPVISFDCRVNPKPFQFSKFSHSTEFVSLIKQIYDEVAYFTVVSLTEKEELVLFCHPCKVSISSIQEVIKHVSKWDHSLNSPKYSFCSIVLSAISTKYDWSFLEPREKFEDYYCSLCNILLSNEFCSWIEHFQSESHILKFQIFMTSKSDHGDTAQLQNTFGNKSSIKLSTDFTQSHINIFADSTSLEAFSQSTYKPDLSKFKNNFHLKEYDKLSNKIGGQVKYFSSELRKKKLRLTCKLCNNNSLMTVEKAASHVVGNEHLSNLMANELDLSEFKNNFHLKEYGQLSNKIGGQVKYFSIIYESQKKERRLKCKLCNNNLLMTVEEAASHVVGNEHLRNLMVPFINEESKMFLGHSSTIYCTLCDVPLFQHGSLWIKHFQSEHHDLQLQKYHDKFWSSIGDSHKKVSVECQQLGEDCEEIKNFKTQSHLLTDAETVNTATFGSDATSLNAKVESNGKPDCTAQIQETDNDLDRKMTGLFSTDQSNPLKVSTSPGAVSPKLKGDVSYCKLSTTIDSDLAQNYANVSVNVNNSFESTSLEPFSQSTSKLYTLQFKEDSHKMEYDTLHKQIGYQIQHFIIESKPQEKLILKCRVCRILVCAKKAVSHVACNSHLSNLMAPFMNEESKIYLGLFETIYCTLCGVPLYKNQHLWLTHFQSEFHTLKLQKYLKNYQSSRVHSYPKASEKCEESFMDCVENINCGSQSDLSAHVKARNTVTYEDSSVTLNANIDLLSKLDSGIREGKDGVLDGQNHAMLLETGIKNTSDAPISPDSSKFIYNLSTLTFAHCIHIAQFLKLMQKINNQVNQFLFESHPESRSLRFICKLCNELFMTFDAAASHMEEQKHKLNIKLLDSKILSTPAIKECPWMFLKPCGSWEGFLCSWCLLEPSSNSDVWMEHFQSKSHNLMLEPLPTYSNLNPGIDSHFKIENSHVTDKKLEDILTTLNPPRNIKDLPSAVSAQPNNFAVKKAKATPKLSKAPPIPLQNALDSKSIQLSQSDKETLKTLITDLDFQVNCFLIYCTSGRINKVICRLCLWEPMPVSEVAAHVELRYHSLNLILPLLSEENKIHLDWCSSTKSYNCLLCDTTLSRGFCLFEHFQNETHQSRLQKLNFDDENSKSDKSRTEIENSTFREEQTINCNALSHAAIMKILNLNQNKHVFYFLVLARNLGWEVNFFSFEPKKDLHIVCLLCNVSCTGYDSAINHAYEEEHQNNVEKNCNEAKVLPWIPKVCDDNWKVLWPFPGLRNYFCKVCKKVLPKKILSWIEHFLGKVHSEKLKELCLLASKEKDEDWARGAMAPKNLFQDTFNVQGLQFSSIAHEAQFENLLRKINYQINFFSICAQERSQELILTCKVCNETLFVSEVEGHINEQDHLLNLAIKCQNKPNVSVPEINQDDWQFLDFDTGLQGYICSLCADKLSSTKESWAEHFQSEAHRSKVKERQIFETSALRQLKEFFSEAIDGSNDKCFDSDIICK